MPEEKLQKMKEDLHLLNVQEVSYITGWSDSTVRDVMNDEKDFPVIKIGRENQVSFEGLKEWLTHRRVRRGE